MNKFTVNKFSLKRLTYGLLVFLFCVLALIFIRKKNDLFEKVEFKTASQLNSHEFLNLTSGQTESIQNKLNEVKIKDDTNSFQNKNDKNIIQNIEKPNSIIDEYNKKSKYDQINSIISEYHAMKQIILDHEEHHRKKTDFLLNPNIQQAMRDIILSDSSNEQEKNLALDYIFELFDYRKELAQNYMTDILNSSKDDLLGIKLELLDYVLKSNSQSAGMIIQKWNDPRKEEIINKLKAINYERF